jgi:hypothetical protein
MFETLQFGLDVSALPMDEFEVTAGSLVIESLTATEAHPGEGGCCHFCACPCVCCE